MSLLCYTRPVGETITLKTSHEAPSGFKGYRSEFYASGTMALQKALEAIKIGHKGEAVDILVPAYACPDLISACVGAGVNPVLVDLAPDSPFPSREQINESMTPNTTGVILYNFLGITPPQDLIDYIREKQFIYIEDRAQSYLAADESSKLQGDYIVFSFGKGKPVSLLGGGQLLIKNTSKASSSQQNHRTLSLHAKLLSTLKALVYNLVISKVIYGWLINLPGLNIGATHYKTPEKPQEIDTFRLSLLNSNIETQYKRRSTKQANELASITSEYNLLRDELKNDRQMLRFPLLISDVNARDKLLEALTAAGIGATAMYQTILTKIDGVPLDAISRKKSYYNAQQFADRLITLPCHNNTTNRDLAKISHILNLHLQLNGAKHNA